MDGPFVRPREGDQASAIGRVGAMEPAARKLSSDVRAVKKWHAQPHRPSTAVLARLASKDKFVEHRQTERPGWYDSPVYSPIHEGGHSMKRTVIFAASLTLALGFAGAAAAQSKKGQPKSAAGAPEAIIYDAASAMAFLTTTAGEWEPATGGQREHGGAAAPTGSAANIVAVKTKAAGSAVVHTYRAGTPGEMETVFHMDGDQLLLTHYCALQNAPILRFEKSDKPGELKFVFQGGTNFDPKIDAHLHESTFQITDRDTVEQRSTVFANGAATPELKSVLHRRSSN
jgi:hypothetical protein